MDPTPHLPTLLRFARKLTRGTGRDPEDLVQDTVVRALTKAHLFRPGTNLAAWLNTLMFNINATQARRAKLENLSLYTSLDVDPTDDIPLQLPDGTASAETTVIVHDLVVALSHIPEKQRNIIMLRAATDMRYDDMAAHLDIPVGTVRSRLYRGRTHLTHLINGLKT